MKRLRSRLIAAFMGVALMAMIPLAIVPYYTLHIRHQKTRTQMLESTMEDNEQYLRKIQDQLLKDILTPAARYIENKMIENSLLISSIEEGNDSDSLSWWEDHIWLLFVKEPFTQYLQSGKDLKIIPKTLYQNMLTWMKEQNFYEDDNKNLYLWYCRTLRKGQLRREKETVGCIFVKMLFIEKSQEADRTYKLNLFSQNPAVKPIIIAPSPSLLQNYLSPQEMGKLFDFDQDGVYETLNISKTVIPWLQRDAPVQAKMIPIVNQRKELAAVMILAIPIVDEWKMVGSTMLISLGIILLISVSAAVGMARSIAGPIKELATAAERMSSGDFSVRVPIAGVKEQKVLSATFNQLADTVTQQLDQLQDQKKELEESNLALEQTHRFLQNILANIHTGVFSLDREGRISLANRAGIQILHLKEVVGKLVEEVIPSDSLSKLIRYSLDNGNSIYQEEFLYSTPNQEVTPLEISIVPLLQEGRLIGLVITFHDLSAMRKLEEQVRRQDRLAALGRMAAGVAHEIRNPLGIIRGSAELLRKRFGNQSGEEGLSQFIIEEVNRLSRVVTDFLLFARPPVPALEEITVEELMDHILAYTQNEWMSDRYPIIKNLEENLPPIAADPKLCRQVFLNLLLNAQQAMPEGGTITIRSRRLLSNSVAIEVMDEGMGIRPELVDRIFDPFFTTKENGTGLGLSLVHQIISSQGGRIEVDSTLNQGTTFRLIFPVLNSMRSQISTPITV